MSINLFIPAAGYGTRLKPLTDHFPKPLLPVCGIPLIQRIIESVQSQVEICTIGVNTHYLPEVVESWALKSPFSAKLKLFHEEEILGTGGALINAKSLFNEGTCLLANGDVISAIDWAELIKFHKESNNLVTLAVQDRTHERRVGADSEMNLVCIDQTCSDPVADHWFGYACAAVYEADFLKYLPAGESHVVPFWVEAAKETGRVKVFDIGRETYWLDIGNPQSYTQAVLDSLLSEKRFLSDPLSTPTDTVLSDIAVIENDVTVGENVALRNVIALPGASIEDGSKLENVIVTSGGIIKIDWPEISENSPRPDKIGNGGSDRIYSREGGKVKLFYSAFEQNIERQAVLTESLLAVGVNVPEIFLHDRNKREVLLEDLGDQTFRHWLQGKQEVDIDLMLNKIFQQLHLFQNSEIDIRDKVFNYDVLRWETAYFLQRFVQRICGVNEDFSDLKKEFHKLAGEVDALPKTLMHRDFQSENIMIKEETPYFIDFQAAHHGPVFFDLVSLLADPYTDLPADLIKKHKTEFFSHLSKRFHMTEEACERAYILCGLQRHMQALGAYGFLAKIRGKEEFLKYVPSALEHLRTEVEVFKEEFPVLHKLVNEIRKKF